MTWTRRSILAIALALASTVVAQTTELVSVSTSDVQADKWVQEARISDDGRYVVFESASGVLVPGDTNFVRDIFVRDMLLGTTERLSVGPAGEQLLGESRTPVLSADGRYVAFTSNADGVVPGVASPYSQIYVRDRATGITSLVSVSPTGEPGASWSGLYAGLAISADGQRVAFDSKATNLVPGAPVGIDQMYVRDLPTGVTVCVSLGLGGEFGNANSDAPSLSADGRFVAFESQASNLVPDDTNELIADLGMDVFVRDLETLTTVRASVSSAGDEANGDSSAPSLSADGRLLVFESWAFNLAPQDAFGYDVFVHDLFDGTTHRISNGPGGWFGNNNSETPRISADGRWVVFDSIASDLVPGDTNNARDVFLHDLMTGTTGRVSITDDGEQVEDSEFRSSDISADGRRVSFEGNSDFFAGLPLTDVTHVFLRDLGPWTDEGFALAGIAGLPTLAGQGSLLVGTPGSLTLDVVAPTAPALLFTSLGSSATPFKCGTLIAFPFSLTLPVVTDVTGSLALSWTAWPGGLSGLSLYFQYAIQDGTAVCGASLSNAIRADVP
jgi:Tol biopolymer transport system component